MKNIFFLFIVVAVIVAVWFFFRQRQKRSAASTNRKGGSNNNAEENGSGYVRQFSTEGLTPEQIAFFDAYAQADLLAASNQNQNMVYVNQQNGADEIVRLGSTGTVQTFNLNLN